MPRRSQLANLLRLLLLLQAAAALAWFAWRWPAAQGQAIVGAACVLLIGPITLALEFVLLARVARADAVPPPGLHGLARAWTGEVRQLVRVFCWRQAFRWRDPPDLLGPREAGRHHGVVFIHGFVCNRGFWAPWLARARAEGRCCIAVNLEPLFSSIDDYAPIIDAAVRQAHEATGLPPVLVCHSMGGVAARAWLRATAGEQRVARIVTIGSPHHGTWLARFSRVSNGRQMRRDSHWLEALRRHEAAHVQPPMTCWYSDCDNIVFPASTAMLPQADNRYVPGIAHVDLAFHADVMQRTFELFDQPA